MHSIYERNAKTVCTGSGIEEISAQHGRRWIVTGNARNYVEVDQQQPIEQPLL